MIDTLKRFWKQNWHRILSAFSVLLVVCSIAFSCGVNSKAMELPSPDGYTQGVRYIPVEVSCLDPANPISFNYVLQPPSQLSSAPAEWYFLYPFIDYGSLESPRFDLFTSFWVEEDGYTSASINLPWWDSGYTTLTFNEFSLLFTNIAVGSDTDFTRVHDPLSYVSLDTFGNTLYIEYNITVARKSVSPTSNPYTYKIVGGTASSYGSFDSSVSVYDFLLEMYYDDSIFDPDESDVYSPARGDVITSVELRIFNDSFDDGSYLPSDSAVPLDIYFEPFSQRSSAINVGQITTVLADPDVDIVIGEGYEAGYIDGKNAGLTEGFGVVDWLVRAGDSVMNFQLFRVADTSVTIGSIFTVIVGSLLIIFILKVFAGG